MNKHAERLLLKNFFSAYFHEDWLCEAENPEAVIAGYAQTSSTSEVRSLGEAILNYSRTVTSDKELEEKLFSDLGCYYLPSADGISAKVWLEKIAEELVRRI